MSKETFLGSIIPAVTATLHRLPETRSFKWLTKFDACIEASLIRVNDCICSEKCSMIFDKKIDRLKDKVNF